MRRALLWDDLQGANHWIAGDLDGRPVLAHDGEWRGFSSEVINDLKGRSASFGFTNTEADDGT